MQLYVFLHRGAPSAQQLLFYPIKDGEITDSVHVSASAAGRVSRQHTANRHVLLVGQIESCHFQDGRLLIIRSLKDKRARFGEMRRQIAIMACLSSIRRIDGGTTWVGGG